MKKRKQIRRISTTLITLLLLGTLLVAANTTRQETSPRSTGNTLYVGGSGPGNYTRIQDAIDNASDGDTVFVYHGVYYENVLVDQSIDLIGENQATTIIDGQGHHGHVVTIIANGVLLSEFTLQNCGDDPNAAELYISSQDISIRNNTMTCTVVPYRGEGIWCMNSSGTIDIERSTITNHDYGIWIEDCTNIVIANNTIMNNREWGIIIGNTDGSSIAHNTLLKNKGGIYLRDSCHNVLARNNITRNTIGICIYEQDANSTGNEVTENNFIRNTGLEGTFILANRSHSKNTWDQNYWGLPHLLPKIILGRKVLMSLPGFPFHFPPMNILIPWFSADWHPARKPCTW